MNMSEFKYNYYDDEYTIEDEKRSNEILSEREKVRLAEEALANEERKRKYREEMQRNNEIQKQNQKYEAEEISRDIEYGKQEKKERAECLRNVAKEIKVLQDKKDKLADKYNNSRPSFLSRVRIQLICLFVLSIISIITISQVVKHKTSKIVSCISLE